MPRTSVKLKFLLVHIILSLLFQVLTADKDVLELLAPNDCRRNEYFDSSSLSCVECEVDLNLVPSSDRLQCECNRYSKVSDFKNGRPVCTPCDSGKVANPGRTECVLCDDTCECTGDQIQIDRHLNGTSTSTMYCLTCPRDTFPSTDKSKCLPCNDPVRKNYPNCDCPSVTHIRMNMYCIPKDDSITWLDMRNSYLVQFDSQHIDSFYLRSELRAAIYLCKKKNKLACEHLSNMCALTLYQSNSACMLFLQTHMSPTWLFYNKDEATAVLSGKRISQTYSLTKDDNYSSLNFTTVAFSLNGRFISIGKPHLPCNMMKKIRFGVNFHKQCKITVSDLLMKNVTFFSPYLVFIKDEKVLMHALPVAIKNNNKDIGEKSQWQLVRKFFLVDSISGFKAIPEMNTGNFKTDINPTVIRYMKHLDILVNVQSGEDRGKIYPPILMVEYAELTKEDIEDNTEVIIDYNVTFLSKDSGIDYNLEVILGSLSGVALIFSGFKTWSYYKRNYSSIPNITLLIWFFIYTMGAVGNIFIISLIGLCIYLFVFYKGQTVPYILLPDDENERSIRICTTIAFCFKCMEVVGFMYQYWTMNIFFIDWEQPRMLHAEYKYDSPHTSLTKTYSGRFAERLYKPAQTPSEIIAARRKKTPRKSQKGNSTRESVGKGQEDIELSTISTPSKASLRDMTEYSSHNLPISIWRTYFIANRWLKLQSQRKISVSFQLIMTAFIFQVFNVNSWTLAVPELNAEFSEARGSFTLYYAVCTLVYIVIYSIQWLGFVAFYERYIKNRMQEFVDLCSITNISVFILPYKYYGFYIHGRSVHGYADTDLANLIGNLKKEENNLCAHRGLVPGTTEQTFIMALTETFNSIYKDLSKEKHDTYRFLRSNHFLSSNWTYIFEVRSKLKYFLSQFIDHCYKSEDYVIKEMHFLERLCDILFTSAKEKSVFYIDKNHTFDQVLLYGNEWLLASFEISLFAFIIAACEDYILACIITALTSITIMIITKCNGKRNLSNKSFLDDRFLI